MRRAFFVMRTSHRGLLAIEAREGVRLHAYRDSEGYPTIGIGHLIVSGDGFSMKSVITQEQCDALFAEDIKKYENAVNSAVKVPLSQNQFDALVSVCLNIGIGGFTRSSIVKRLNAKNYSGAAEAIMMWKKPAAIIGRRRTEQKQFLTPYPKVSVASPTQPEPGLNSKDATTSLIPQESANQQEPPTPEGTPITQTADTIVNTADISNAPPPEDKTLTAPPKDGATATSTKMVIAGVTVPPVLAAILKAISDGINQGFVNAQDIGTFLLGFLRDNIKWVLLLIGLMIVLLIVKKIIRTVTFWLEMISKMVPKFNNVTVVPAEPEPPTPWYIFWKS